MHREDTECVIVVEQRAPIAYMSARSCSPGAPVLQCACPPSFVAACVQESLATLGFEITPAAAPGAADPSPLHCAVAALLHARTAHASELTPEDCNRLLPLVQVLLPPNMTPGQLALVQRAGQLHPVVTWMETTGFFADAAKLKAQLEVGCPPPHGIARLWAV